MQILAGKFCLCALAGTIQAFKIISLPMVFSLLFQCCIFITHGVLLAAAHTALRAGTRQAAGTSCGKTCGASGYTRRSISSATARISHWARLQQRRLKKLFRLRQFMVITILSRRRWAIQSGRPRLPFCWLWRGRSFPACPAPSRCGYAFLPVL